MTTTFDLLETSRALGDVASSECSTAILLLTDGEITVGLGASEVSALVEISNADIEAEVFTFALGQEADVVSGGSSRPLPMEWSGGWGCWKPSCMTLLGGGTATFLEREIAHPGYVSCPLSP